MDNAEMLQESRNKIASQIKIGRSYEENLEDKDRYKDARDLASVINDLRGISGLLSYVRENQSVLGSNLILDIGTGDGLAASQLLRSNLSADLQVVGTTLKLNSRIKGNLENKFHITPVETLYGIKDSSVATIISNYGLSYSLAPEMAAESIDRVMVPSGLLKATFYLRERENTREIHPRTPDAMASELRKLGWKVETYNIDNGYQIMLASKPPALVDLGKLMEDDKSSFYNQIKELESNDS